MSGKPVSICTFVQSAIPYAFETECVDETMYVKPGKVRQLSVSGIWEYRKNFAILRKKMFISA